MIVKPSSRLPYFSLLIVCCLWLASCANESSKAAPSDLKGLYQSVISQDKAEPILHDLNTAALLAQMQPAVANFQNELKGLDQKIEEVQSARRTQTGIMLNDTVFDRLIAEMTHLQEVMKPLCAGLGNMPLPFEIKNLQSKHPNTEFGQPPLANQIVLQQLSTDVQERERAILEALMKQAEAKKD